MPKGQYNRTQPPKESRLGCVYADRFYAALKGITEEEAQKVYKCSYTDSEDHSPACPFPELPECLQESGLTPQWKLGIVKDRLNIKTAKLVPLNAKSKTYMECSGCKAQRVKEYYPPNYCLRCGAKFV